METTLDLRHLLLFEQLAGVGGLNRAATRMHATPSALSHRLRTLEERLGTPLFRRERRRLAPTPAGRALLAGAPAALEGLRRLEAQVRAAALRPEERVIRLATECYTCYGWLLPALSRLATTHPHTRVELAPEATRRPLAALTEGRLDVAVVSAPPRARRCGRGFPSARTNSWPSARRGTAGQG